jgi:hypothetical protein
LCDGDEDGDEDEEEDDDNDDDNDDDDDGIVGDGGNDGDEIVHDKYGDKACVNRDGGEAVVKIGSLALTERNDDVIQKSVRSVTEDLSVAGTRSTISTKSSGRRMNASKMSSWKNLRYYSNCCDGFAKWHSAATQDRKILLDKWVREAVTGNKKSRNRPVLMVLRTGYGNDVEEQSAFDYMMCEKQPFG